MHLRALLHMGNMETARAISNISEPDAATRVQVTAGDNKPLLVLSWFVFDDDLPETDHLPTRKPRQEAV